MQSDWLKLFWPISQEQTFSQIWGLCGNTANNINFHYRSNSVKINDQISQQIEKILFFAHFWPIFPIFGAKKIFPEYPALPRTTSHGILAPCQISEKANDAIPRKRLDKWTNGKTDRPYFIGSFRLPPWV